jgi:hypothetical protein
MAKLLRLAREKEERERAAGAAPGEGPSDSTTEPEPGETIVTPTIPQETIVTPTGGGGTIVNQTIDGADKSPRSSAKRVAGARPAREARQRQPSPAGSVDVSKGYYPSYNDISDRLIPETGLNPFEQSVLQRLYRLSRGWKSDECEISHAEIVRSCNISKSQSQRTLAKLSARGLIVNLGRSKSGPERNRFRVLPGVPVIPHKNIFREDISREGDDIASENTVVGQDIFSGDTNKNSNKESLNTHTQPGVGVGSKFSLEECKRFAEHLQKTGQGINNPGGYATAIFRSGEADAQIEAFLNAPAASVPFKADDCPDCGGSGYFYPEGVDKGVKICKHEKLKGTRQS